VVGDGGTNKATKKPLAARDNPQARDSKGKASRTEIRKATTRVNAPRVSNRPVERGNSKKSSKS